MLQYRVDTYINMNNMLQNHNWSSIQHQIEIANLEIIFKMLYYVHFGFRISYITR